MNPFLAFAHQGTLVLKRFKPRVLVAVGLLLVAGLTATFCRSHADDRTEDSVERFVEAWSPLLRIESMDLEERGPTSMQAAILMVNRFRDIVAPQTDGKRGKRGTLEQVLKIANAQRELVRRIQDEFGPVSTWASDNRLRLICAMDIESSNIAHLLLSKIFGDYDRAKDFLESAFGVEDGKLPMGIPQFVAFDELTEFVRHLATLCMQAGQTDTEELQEILTELEGFFQAKDSTVKTADEETDDEES